MSKKFKMKYKAIFLVLTIFTVFLNVKGQGDVSVVAKVGELPITVNELKYAYVKSLKSQDQQKRSVTDFLETYITYKRKVAEALSLKLDTISSFKEEYQMSVDLIQEPYLKDTTVIQELAKLIYNRLSKNYKVKDIVVGFPLEDILYPKDTIEAYQIVKKIRSDIKKDGSNYDEISKSLALESVMKQGVVTGNYGWLSTLMLEPSVENQIYRMKKGDVSIEPFRSEKGYHILKIEDERPDIGAVSISNIVMAYPRNATALEKDSIKNQVNQIYEQLKSGADFLELHKKYSLDYLVNPSGYLGYYGVQKPLSPILEEMIKDIPDGGYTRPFQKGEEMCILLVNRRIDKYDWDDIKDDIKQKINSRNDVYHNYIVAGKIKNLSSKIPYQINSKTYLVLQKLTDISDVFSDKFREEANKHLADTFLQIDTTSYTVKDFLLFIDENKDNRYSRLTTDQLLSYKNDFVYTSLLNKKKQALGKEYPELINVAREYYEGILYYNLMSSKVWNKAEVNKTELEKLYNKNKRAYTWDSPRFQGLLIFAKNEKIKQEVKDFIAKNRNSNSLMTDLRNAFNRDADPQILLEKGFWTKGENSFIDYVVYKLPQTKTMVDYPECFVEGSFVQSPRDMNDVKGQVIADYQKILEKQLDRELIEKYPVQIDKKVLGQINIK